MLVLFIDNAIFIELGLNFYIDTNARILGVLTIWYTCRLILNENDRNISIFKFQRKLQWWWKQCRQPPIKRSHDLIVIGLCRCVGWLFNLSEVVNIM